MPATGPDETNLAAMLPPGFRLRDAVPGDALSARSLVFDVLHEFGLRPDPEGADRDLIEFEAHYGPRGGWFAVLTDGEGTVVGTVALREVTSGVVELRKMYLRSKCRGLGLGRLLLEAALGEARRRGYRKVRLETATVLREAVRMYERRGFRDATEVARACRCDRVMELELSGHTTGPLDGAEWYSTS